MVWFPKKQRINDCPTYFNLYTRRSYNNPFRALVFLICVSKLVQVSSPARKLWAFTILALFRSLGCNHWIHICIHHVCISLPCSISYQIIFIFNKCPNYFHLILLLISLFSFDQSLSSCQITEDKIINMLIFNYLSIV